MRRKLVMIKGDTTVKLMERLLSEKGILSYYKDCLEETFVVFENHYEDGMSAYHILQSFSSFKETLPARLITLRNNKEPAGKLAAELIKKISDNSKKM